MEGEEERRRLDVVERRRDLERHVRVDDRVLGVAAERADRARHDPPSQPLLEPGAGRVDDPDDLHAQRVRQRRVHGEVAPLAAVDLVLVQHRRVHADPQLPRARLGTIDVDEGQRVER